MIHTGDCIEVMAGMPSESVDAVITDPPSGIHFMSKKWDHNKGGRTEWVAWMTEVMLECYRLLKPGGYAVVWSLPRTCHWTAWAMEDAGFIIRDQLAHIFASGFPKGKAQLKPAREDWWLARKPGPLRPLAIDGCRIPSGDELIATHHGTGRGTSMQGNADESWPSPYQPGDSRTEVTAGRWPSNVLLQDPELFDVANPYVVGSGATAASAGVYRNPDEPKNVGERGGMTGEGFLGGLVADPRRDNSFAGEVGGYSRFFIIPKADRGDREPVLRGQLERGEAAAYDHRPSGDHAARLNRVRSPVIRENGHPTVKPTDLMRHLVRLVTPSRNEDGEPGLVLDPFLGSGSTAIAAELEGFRWVGIEQDASYVAIAEARLNGTQRGLGLDVSAPVRKRVENSGKASGPNTEESSSNIYGWAKGGIHKSGAHYGDGPKRPPKPPKSVADTAPVWGDEPEEAA